MIKIGCFRERDAVKRRASASTNSVKIKKPGKITPSKSFSNGWKMKPNGGNQRVDTFARYVCFVCRFHIVYNAIFPCPGCAQRFSSVFLSSL